MSLITMEPTDEGQSRRIALEQIDVLYRVFPTGVIGGAAGAILLVVVLRVNDAVAPARGTAWALFICGMAVLHLLLGIAYRRAGDKLRIRPRWPVLFCLCALSEGIGWGWATVALPKPGHFEYRLLVLLVAAAIAGGGAAAFGAYRPAFLSILLPVVTPFYIASLSAPDRLEHSTGWLMIVFTASVISLGFAATRSSRYTIKLRLLSEALAFDLQQQKEIAERANVAKSSFLAAASHDLRQPVHALGLFTGALRGLALPPEARHLTDRIDASVEALDGLFSALLDISRLDAGIVEVHVRAFPVGPLIERICADHADEARAKGLILRCAPTTLSIKSDPVLVERILRNLIGNAARHTTNGSVLAGARRRGDQVVLEVRDTGPGIAPAEHERIFDEYYQIGNAERDRANGLGLGLAIVRRLTTLLGTQVVLRSQPGRGACFAVTLPRGTGLAAADPAAAPPTSPDEGLVVVVDDEADIRDAMTGLLRHWGFEVIAAASGDDALAQLAVSPIVPRLLICDYRLRDGETGIEVVARLRDDYNASIPAMLITGDTAPSRLIEARASGLALLHKPVTNARLRAAIATVIAGTDA